MTGMRQMALDLRAEAAFGRGHYVAAAANRDALRLIEEWPDWPAPKLALVGPQGAGKSHLAHIWADRAGADVLGADALLDLPATLVPGRSVVVDGADRLAGRGEAALLHLHNLVLAEGGALLLTGRTPPARWPVALADLASRLAATPVARIAAPDDGLLSAVLAKHFADRGIAVAPPTIRYMVARMDRSFDAAARLAARLDAVALSAGRPVTRALAAQILAPPSLNKVAHGHEP